MTNSQRAGLAAVLTLAFVGLTPSARAINLDAATPLQHEVLCTGYANHHCSATWVLPANKLVKIEYVSVYCRFNTSAARLDTWYIGTQTNGGSQNHYFNVPAAVVNGSIVDQIGGQVVSIYANPNSTITYNAYFVNETAAPTCSLQLSGQQLTS